MYCFSAGFRNFVRGKGHADERILQIEKESPVMPELRLSSLVENARCMSLRMCRRDPAETLQSGLDCKKCKKSEKMCRSKRKNLHKSVQIFQKGRLGSTLCILRKLWKRRSASKSGTSKRRISRRRSEEGYPQNRRKPQAKTDRCAESPGMEHKTLRIGPFYYAFCILPIAREPAF